MATDDATPDRGPPADGQTRPVQGDTPQRAPRLPHERDESADSQAAGDPVARRRGKMAHDDLKDGLVDTDKGPVLDAVYEPMRKEDEAKDGRGGKPPS